LAKRGWGNFMDNFLSEKSPLTPEEIAIMEGQK